MGTWSKNTPPTWAPNAVATEKGWEDPQTGEVLVAIKGLDTSGKKPAAKPAPKKVEEPKVEEKVEEPKEEPVVEETAEEVEEVVEAEEVAEEAPKKPATRRRSAKK